MLTGFTMAVPILNKSSEMICNAYRDHVYCVFGGSSRILMDKGSEFKNKEMQESSIISPQCTESNGCLEGWHRFFKACIAKHIHGGRCRMGRTGTTGSEHIQLLPMAKP